jgi:hypothetical protein
MTTEIARHAPVIALLREQGIAAEEAASGGNFYHVSFELPDGGYVLADANEGWWLVGLYRPTDDPYWRMAEGEMHDADLQEDADPALVAAWLLDVAR